MKIKSMFVASLVAAVALGLSACMSSSSGGSASSAGGGTTTTPVPDVAAVLQSTGAFGAFMVNKTGETLLPMVSPDRGTLAGAMWKSEQSGGASVVVYFDANGFPEKTVFGDFIFLFSNWNPSALTVDIAEIYGPSGYIQVFKGVSLPAGFTLPTLSASSAMAAKTTCFPACSTDTQNLAELIKFAGLGISVGACGVATTVSLGAMALPCAGAIVTTAIAVTDNEAWLENLGDVGDILSRIDYFQCALGDASGCLSSALDLSSNLLGDLVLGEAEYEPLEAEADAALDDPLQPSGVVEPGSGLPVVPSGSYECTPGGSMSYEPCLSGGVRTCQPDYTWSNCPDNPTGEEIPDDSTADGGDTGGGDTGGGTPGDVTVGGTCASVANTCSACAFSACIVKDADGNCTGAYYTTSDGGRFNCASCSSCEAAANSAANHCVSVCFGL